MAASTDKVITNPSAALHYLLIEPALLESGRTTILYTSTSISLHTAHSDLVAILNDPSHQQDYLDRQWRSIIPS